MINETKQTAVEWLINSLNSYDKVKEMFDCFEHEIKQAKEMEKEQIIDACWAGGDDGERYYNETYGGNK